MLLKTISDFTGAPLFRLPLHLGGAYWLFNLAMSQVSVFVCVHLYNKFAPGADKMNPAALWAGAGGLTAAFIITFLYFAFRVAVPRYVRERDGALREPHPRHR